MKDLSSLVAAGAISPSRNAVRYTRQTITGRAPIAALFCCAVNTRWRSQGWCDGEEQSVPAPPCHQPPPPNLPLADVKISVIVCMAHFE